MKFDVVVFTKPEEHGIATKRISLVNGEVVSHLATRSPPR
jgi:hypothetical protein